MRVSNIKKNKNNENGFTLIELIIVIAGIAALGTISFPPFLNSLKLNRVEEAKAIMNGYAAECLEKFRDRTSWTQYSDEEPTQLSENKLNTLGYTITPEKDKCIELEIKPNDEKEKDLYVFGFSVSPKGKVIKKGTPTDKKSFRNSCYSWAGKGCGASPEQLAQWEEEAALEQRREDCIAAENEHRADKTRYSTPIETWDKSTDPPSCTKIQYMYEGANVNPMIKPV